MSDTTLIRRRDFLKTGAAWGGGLLIGLYLPAVSRGGRVAAAPETFTPNAFVRIGTDDIVTIIINKSEMGQGVYQK
jgi:isoquinoline 1-oxidoreductase beta subunit